MKQKKDVNTDTLKEEIIRVFKQIHLCGPRVFQSSIRRVDTNVWIILSISKINEFIS